MSQLTSLFAPGIRVFLPTMSNQSGLLIQELKERPDRLRGVEVCGLQFPGIDTFDPLSLHPEVRQTAYFMTDGVRKGLAQGQASLLGLDYTGIVRHLGASPPFDLAIAQVSEPDRDGWCSPGLSCDFLPLVWRRAHRRVAHINPRMPRVASSFRIHVSELDASVVSDQALLDFQDPIPGDVERRIGTHVAELVRDGDTLQFGIGSVPLGLASALTGHRQLRFHGGLASSAIQTLWDAGALNRDHRITAGVALGNASFRDFIADLGQLWLTSVDQTHDFATLARTPRFTAINSAVEVDLFGQVNAERMGGVLAAGAGGLPAFAQGALASPGGRSIVCLASTARKGQVTRIVPAIGSGGLCTLPRYLADTFITEHGVAQVRHLSMDERAQALIAIAAPEHRAGLAQAWQAQKAQR